MTDGNTYAINKYLYAHEDYDALEEVAAELEQAEARIDELETKLAKAREEGFWVGRSCGGAWNSIDAALAELKGQE